MKQIASPGLMHEIGCSGLVRWVGPEGWDGEGGGMGIQDGGHVHPRLSHGSLSAGFSRQEWWMGLPFPPPGTGLRVPGLGETKYACIKVSPPPNTTSDLERTHEKLGSLQK